jgi:hypothetical protein
MRSRLFLSAVIAVLPPAGQPARAQAAGAACADGDGTYLLRDGIRNVQGHTRAGQPCQMGFGLRGPNIVALEILVRPEHGVLGVSGKEDNRRYIAYAPQKGFAGRDRFEVFIRFTPAGSSRIDFTRVKVEMNVTP